jgi:lipoprotein-anchoring transpeptidase ErfK/SrfK
MSVNRFVVSMSLALAAIGIQGSAGGAQPTIRKAALEARNAANQDSSLRVVISVARRRLWVVSGAADTMLAAPVGVGSERSLAYAGHRWRFSTPRGIHTVLSKEENPVWIPPDWHYVEVARRERLALVWLHGDTTIELSDGSSLVMRNMDVRIERNSTSRAFPVDEEIVAGNTLFVPPIGSPNRRVTGELGKFRLMLGDGVGIHGTLDTASVGNAVTHGCMRLHDADLAWLYEHVPVGTRVYIF